MKKLTRPYFRLSIKGYYPEGSNQKLKVKLYFSSEAIIGQIIQYLAKFK